MINENRKKTPRKSKLHIDEDLELTPEEETLKETELIAPTIEMVKRTLEEQVGLGKSFDVIFREMTFGDKKCALFYLNGFVKDNVLVIVVSRLTNLKPEELGADALQALFSQYVAHIQVEKVDSMKQAVHKVLAGATALFIEGESKCIIIDAKNFPQRNPEEPTLERVVRGARDGFIETLLTNVSLMRRRIRDPRLKLEMMEMGRRTKTDICIAYINDIVDMTLVEAVKKKIKEFDIEGLPLADKQLEEVIIRKGWNPFPMVRYSERPDVVGEHLLEGHVALFVDTSPSVMILPTTLFTLTQHAEENRQSPFMGTYLRWVRFFGIFASLFMLPIWFLYVLDPAIKPAFLAFLGPQKTASLPILMQFIFAEMGVDLVRLAAIHTPTPLATALGLVAAVLVGQVAVETGLLINEVILYMAIAAIGMFATPSYELGLANKITRLFLLIMTALFHVSGLVAGSTFVIVMLAVQRSFNSPYLWPLIPFHPKGMMEVILRRPLLTQRFRPTITKPYDRDRMK